MVNHPHGSHACLHCQNSACPFPDPANWACLPKPWLVTHSDWLWCDLYHSKPMFRTRGFDTSFASHADVPTAFGLIWWPPVPLAAIIELLPNWIACCPFESAQWWVCMGWTYLISHLSMETSFRPSIAMISVDFFFSTSYDNSMIFEASPRCVALIKDYNPS